VSTVYRLPEEPPIGTTVRPEPDTGKRYTRSERGWSEKVRGTDCIYVAGPWANLLHFNPDGLVVVEPDPHPTPWYLDDTDSDSSRIFDANRNVVARLTHPRGLVIAERIVDAVNKAATT
jgi:hypothetical protein